MVFSFGITPGHLRKTDSCVPEPVVSTPLEALADGKPGEELVRTVKAVQPRTKSSVTETIRLDDRELSHSLLNAPKDSYTRIFCLSKVGLGLRSGRGPSPRCMSLGGRGRSFSFMASFCRASLMREKPKQPEPTIV